MNEVLKITPVPAYARILIVVATFGWLERDKRPGRLAPKIEAMKITKMLAMERGRLKSSTTKEQSSA